jgi:DNA-binding NarL/FixJ family response regulator
MDIRLPGMNGTDALIAIRKEFPTGLVIMLTSADGNTEIDRALRAGAARYILKSMPKGEMLAVIRAGKSGRRAHSTRSFVPPCRAFVGQRPNASGAGSFAIDS